MRRIAIVAMALWLGACKTGGAAGEDDSKVDAGPGDDDDDDDDDDGDGGGGKVDDDPGTDDGEGDIDFSNNLLPSPMPPGNLKPSDAPQIIVFGWDDIAFTGDHPDDAAENNNGMNFIAKTFGPLKNPDGSKAGVTFYQNAAYLPNTEAGGPWGSETNLMLAAGKELVDLGFEVGNHTFDHLESNGTWGKIPAKYKTGQLGGWAESAGTILDTPTWQNPVIGVNDQILRSSYGQSKLTGFRAPRLEINGDGLAALKASGYVYDTSLEDGQQAEFVTVATRVDAATKGFKWVTWPYTLDNGSPGLWASQDGGGRTYVKSVPAGLWEVPVYMVYLPDNGLQQEIAARMKKEIKSEDTSWIGDRVREITAFDFNTFLYARMTKDEWVAAMKHTFLTRYNGNRAPLTFGAHPEEFSSRYDTAVLGQANNEDFRDVLNYATYRDRKAAVLEFVNWVKTTYPKDAFFLSGQQLVDYMKNPWDKNKKPVTEDKIATPTSYNIFKKLSQWEVNKDAFGSDAKLTIVDDNTLNVEFTVGRENGDKGEYPWVDVASYFEAGALARVSHFDVVYETTQPVRLRLVTEENGPLSTQVLLAGVGGERKARIRIKDFTPDPYADATKIAAAGFVDSAYMAKVTGLAIESASTIDRTKFTFKLKRIIVHGGVATSGVKASLFSGVSKRIREVTPRRDLRSVSSSVLWPRHEEVGAH